VRVPGLSLLRHPGMAGGVGVLVALIAWNLGNFIFFVIAGRILGPDDYGLVAALLAATMIALVPAGAFQFALARQEGALAAAGSPRLGAVYRAAYVRSLWVVPAATAVVVAAIAALGTVVEMPVGPMLATVATIVPMAALFLSLGQLQGESRFGAFSLSISMIGVPRPFALLALAGAGLGVYAALGASAIALGIAAVTALAFTLARLREAPAADPAAWRAFRTALAPLAAGLAGVAVLTNLDVIVAKLALSDQQAGEFAAIAVLAKSVVLIPQAASAVLLPRVAARRASDRETGPLLVVAVAVTLAAGLAATAVAAAFATPIVRVTYGEEYVDGASLLAPLTAASTLLGAIIVLLNHHAGRGADAYVWGVGAVGLVQPLLFVPLHGSEGALIVADVIAYALCLGLHEALHGRGPDGLVRSLGAIVRRRGPVRSASP
jgi:O-antigen/teichoic acid export membrane protein